MKKYEKYTKSELHEICKTSESYREVAIKIGYYPDAGKTLSTVKKMIADYGFDISHFKGKAHTKNIGKKKTQTNEYLNNTRNVTAHKLRLRLLEEHYFEYKCSCCGLTEWLGKPIPLELHHKDGNKNNNKLENLELRCPNCHYFTETYKTKNRLAHKSKKNQ